MLAAGMQETDLMAIVGWKSRDIVAQVRCLHASRASDAAARKLEPR